MILLIDNFDSFSYNLYQMLGGIDPDIRVVRNNAVTIAQIREMDPSGIVLSPGPGRPEDSGICPEVVRQLKGRYPILGVCLGEQTIAYASGAVVGYAKKILHGKQSLATLDQGSPIFRGLPERIKVARYHSLAVLEDTLEGTGLHVTAKAEDGEVMAIEDTDKKLFGLQFHPESVMTPQGILILQNFESICKRRTL